MASSSKKPYNRSYSPDNTTDSSTDVALPLQYDTEEDLIQVFKSLRDELESRTELKWEQTGKGKGVKKEDLLQIVLEVSNFFFTSISEVEKYEKRKE